MDRAITATEANQNFSRLLRDVQNGESFVITSRDRAVARLTPVAVDEAEQLTRQAAGLRAAHAYVDSLPKLPPMDWKREDLYD